MKLSSLLIGAVAALLTTSASAACNQAGRCFDQWGNMIPTEQERRFDEQGRMRINLANETRYSFDPQWSYRRDRNGHLWAYSAATGVSFNYTTGQYLTADGSYGR
jgi:hypothetical protein